MIKAGQIEKGTALLIKGQPFLCIEREFVNPGKGSAFVRLKLKSPATGQTLSETMKSQDNAEDITIEDRAFQYLYNDGENFAFMNVENYDQIEVPMKSFPDYEYIMKDGETYRLTLWEDQVLDIQVPSKVVFVVTETEDAARGDTVQGVTKDAVLETGLKIRVPGFIKQGEKVRVNTETKEYLERVND